jgi:hypothetical protein
VHCDVHAQRLAFCTAAVEVHGDKLACSKHFKVAVTARHSRQHANTALLLSAESRCAAGAAYISRYQTCVFYTALSIAANPGVEYSMFTEPLTWPEARDVCTSMGRGLVKLVDATQDAQLYAAVTARTGSQYW